MHRMRQAAGVLAAGGIAVGAGAATANAAAADNAASPVNPALSKLVSIQNNQGEDPPTKGLSMDLSQVPTAQVSVHPHTGSHSVKATSKQVTETAKYNGTAAVVSWSVKGLIGKHHAQVCGPTHAIQYANSHLSSTIGSVYWRSHCQGPTGSSSQLAWGTGMVTRSAYTPAAPYKDRAKFYSNAIFSGVPTMTL